MPAETHSHAADAFDPVAIEAMVLDHLAELLGRDIDDLAPQVRLRDDLDADDLVLLDLFDVVEDELGERTVGFRLDDDALMELHTVADLVEYIVNVTSARRGTDREMS